jgi:hypothetical protein
MLVSDLTGAPPPMLSYAKDEERRGLITTSAILPQSRIPDLVPGEGNFDINSLKVH